MIILPEDKNIISLLPPGDAKQVLLALFSADMDLPEMTPLANMAFTVIKANSEKTLNTKNAKRSRCAEKPAHVSSATTQSTPASHEDGTLGLQEKRFSEFWAAYPRKIGKESARKAWLRIHPTNEHHAKILFAIEKAKKCEQWRRDNGQYIPHPATWLNQGRWDDEVQPDGVKLPRMKPSNIANFVQREYDAEFFDKFITTDFGK